MRIKNKLIKNIVLVIVAVTMLDACQRIRPIYEVHSQVIPATGTSLTVSQVETRIIKAGASLGWLMKPVKPGLVLGTIRGGKHSAVVRIEYDTNTYSILYDASQRLYEGIASEGEPYEGQRVIHKRYNQYVKTLNRQIETYLLASGS